ncbi:MAG: twin-arginine translocation protein TatA/E family subunit [Frankiales bacterium]|nr:twin-arginine translocation protein TatA/E family subunit [Frankiales bacterium]
MASLPGGWELVLILVVVLVVFGSKRLPDSARALGRSLRILKAETKGLRTDGDEIDPAVLPPGQPRFDPYTGEPLKPPAPGDTRP